MSTTEKRKPFKPSDDQVAWLVEYVDERPDGSQIADRLVSAALELKCTEGQAAAHYYRAKRRAQAEADQAQNTQADAEDGELFPAADFDDPKLTLDVAGGRRIDSISLSLGGEIALDRLDAEHVELFRELHLGRGATITLRVQADRLGYHQRRRRHRTDTVAMVKLGAGAIESWELDAETAADGQEDDS